MGSRMNPEDGGTMRHFLMLIAALTMPALASAAEPCSAEGTSGGYSCSHVELVATLSAADMGGSGEPLSDIWGWTDPDNGEEYAIVGMYDGTAFVRIEADGTPTFLGRLDSTDGESPVAKGGAPVQTKSCDDGCGENEASTWRDVKVLGNVALIVSEAEGFGMQVFDLTRLRGLSGPPASDFQEDAYYDGVGHAHNVVVNEARQRAYIVGAGSRGAGEGGLHIVDLSDPMNPVFLGAVDGDGYTHDAQCVNYAGPSTAIPAGNDICFAANEDTLTIWDVTDPANPEVLSKSTYSQTAYTHQVWVSEDQSYAYLNDELDEETYGLRTNTRIFDVSDPANPEFVGEYLAPTWSIDHNNYVNGRFLYQSNYLAGLRIIDIAAPEAPVEAAYFDVSPTDAALFDGTWSNYPYFDSGYIVTSGISQGLFVLRSEIDTTSTQADLVVTTTVDTATDDSQPFTVSVENAGGISIDEPLLAVHTPRAGGLEVDTAADGWTCVPDRSLVECRAASIASGESVEFTLVAQGNGDEADVRMVAAAYGIQADATPADNRKQTVISLPAYDTGSSTGAASSGGSGGGGALGGLLFGLLMALRGAALRRR